MKYFYYISGKIDIAPKKTKLLEEKKWKKVYKNIVCHLFDDVDDDCEKTA